MAALDGEQNVAVVGSSVMSAAVPPPSGGWSGERLAFGGAVVAGVIGAGGLLGWLTGTAWLVRPLPLGTAARPNSSLAFLLLAVGAAASRRRSGSPVPLIVGAAAMAMGTLSLVESALDVGDWFDELFVADERLLGVSGGSARPAPSTSVSILLLGTATVALRRPRARLLRESCAVAAMVIASGLAVGYVVAGAPFPGLGSISSTSVPSVVAIALLASALLLIEQGAVVAFLVGQGPGSVAVRRLGPTIFLITLAMLRLRFESHRRDWVDVETGISLLGTGGLVASLAAIALVARSLNAVDDARVQADAEARRTDERFRVIVETAQEGVWALDADDRTTYVNAQGAAILGLEPASMLGRPALEVLDVAVPPDGDVPARWRPGLRGRHELAARRPGGELVWLSVAGSPLYGENGAYEGSVALVADVTDAHRQREEIEALNRELEARVVARTADLERANGELEAFAYSVSHDLRAPLRAVSGFVEILEQDHRPELSDEASRLLDVITRNAEKMGVLIDELLRLSRVGRVALDEADIALAPLVAEVLDTLQSELAGREIELAVGHLPTVRGDAVLLRQVLANLVGNAVKFTAGRRPARVSVGYGPTERGVDALWVRDNGAGFDERYAGKLFGVFERLHSTEEFPGTGVGLATVKRIIERHGGEVWAEGSPGHGATFYATFGEVVSHDDADDPRLVAIQQRR